MLLRGRWMASVTIIHRVKVSHLVVALGAQNMVIRSFYLILTVLDYGVESALELAQVHQYFMRVKIVILTDL